MVSVGIGPTSLLHAADRALLLHALGAGPPEGRDQDLATRLEKIPIFTASEFVIYLLGEDAYVGRLGQPGLQPRRGLARPLTADEKAQRKQRLEAALGVEDVSQMLDQLRTSANVMYVIDNKVTYCDVQ